MKPKLLLRISSAFMLIHTIGHSFGALTWKQAPNATIARIINDMETNHFDFMGRSCSIASFFEGYGIGMIGVLLLISVTLWLLSNHVESMLTSQLLTILTVFLLFFAASEYIYFFPFAGTISLLAGLCALFARIGLKRASQNS